MPGKLTLQVGYVGTRGMRLPVFVDANLIGQTPHGARTYNVLNASDGLTKQLTVPVYIQTDRRNTSLASFNTGFSVANTWYNSMAVTVRRPFANGLEFLMNYTWARQRIRARYREPSVPSTAAILLWIRTTSRRENGLSDIDIRNRMALSVVYKPRCLRTTSG